MKLAIKGKEECAWCGSNTELFSVIAMPSGDEDFHHFWTTLCLSCINKHEEEEEEEEV